MHDFLIHLFHVFFRLGGPGLFFLGALDSSFLFMPLGNDILMVALTARRPEQFWFYWLMATAGSTTGCAIVDFLARKGGEEGLGRIIPERRIDYVKRKVSHHAGRVLALAAIMPPPFPFTPFVAGAAALQYPRRKMFPILAGMRAVRFGVLGWLAMEFGRRILKIAESPWVVGFVVLILVVAVVGSIVSVVGWIRRARRAPEAAHMR